MDLIGYQVGFDLIGYQVFFPTVLKNDSMKTVYFFQCVFAHQIF